MSTDALPGFEHLAAPAEKQPRRAGPSPEELLEGLNEPQRAAVVHAGTPLLVVAGAGSGKTRVLTRRIAWLISERKAHPGSILAITFTNKAAAEMRERVEELVGRRARIMWVSTFHSACVRILRKEITALDFGGVHYKSSFSIYDAADQKRLMTNVAKSSTSTRSGSSPARCCTGSPTTKMSCATPRRPPPGRRTSWRSSTPRPTPSTSGGCGRPTRSTSTT